MDLLEAINTFLEKKHFIVTAQEVYNYWEAKDWKNNKGVPVRDLGVLCSVVNGLKKSGHSIKPEVIKRRLQKKKDKASKNNQRALLLSTPRELLHRSLGSINFKGAKKKRVCQDINEKREKLIDKRTKYEAVYEKYLKGLNKKYLIQAPVPIKVGNKVYTTYPDFMLYCEVPKVIIEIDGEYHNEEHYQQWDKIKTDKWTEMGYKVIRYTNSIQI